MNSDVHPVVAGAVLLATVVAIALWAWASGVATAFGGPAGLQTGPRGHHFIEIQNYLVEHDANGEYVATHDLRALDADRLLGGYAFFSNGDILLRRGPDPRSFLDNLRAYQRLTNRNSTVPGEPGRGLYRCDLDTSDCTQFGEEGIDFKAAFSVFIDWQTDEVYISDTTRHLLRKYSPDGVEQVAPVGGFRFPNQLTLHHGRLLVADTNHHVIRALDPRSSSFGDELVRNFVVPAAAKSAGQEWPSHFARVGEAWWVNNMRTGMNEGGIYVFDDDWQFLRRVALPPEADPISLLPVGDEIWVSDWNHDVVRRFSTAGEPLPDLQSPGLETILVAARQERLRYKMLSYAGVALVVVMLLGLIVRAFALAMNKDSSRQSAGSDSPTTKDDNTAPLYLEPDEKMHKRVTLVTRLVMALTLLTVGLTIYLFRACANPDVMLTLAGAIGGLVAIVLLIVWINRANWGTSIHINGRTLTLRDYTGRQSSCGIRDARFDDSAIATRDAVVILGRPQAQIYKREEIQERLIPRLTDAQRVGPIAMLKILIMLKHPQGLFSVLLLVGVVAWGVVTLAS